MKAFVIFVPIAILAISNADPATESQKLRGSSKVCEANLGEPKNLLDKLKAGEDIGDKTKAGKMALCINVDMGHMNQNGETIPDLFKEHVNRFTEDPEKRKQLIENCGPKNGNTPQEAALNFVNCMQKYLSN